jgi:hypothetical protein
MGTFGPSQPATRPSKEGICCINQLLEAILLADCWYTATGQLRSGLAAGSFPEAAQRRRVPIPKMHGLSGYHLLASYRWTPSPPLSEKIYARALVLSQGDCGTASTDIKLMYNDNSVSRKVE